MPDRKKAISFTARTKGRVRINRIFSLFETLVAEGKTILMVTHDWSLAERASRTLQLKDGVLTGEVAS